MYAYTRPSSTGKRLITLMADDEINIITIQ